ncbi:LysR family transcriptional regulator [Sneathiella sp.]|jgi:DNA-binding transcriptional LysR family regulator|uniref:LysR family transcriptional regulator n=1 Tax=Sneathiella sp. TaxID=1964365 RepID=UPI0039E3AEB4
MNFKQLETFVWVATLGSFRKAAKKLYTSQPAVSSRIVALEQSLGTELFSRHAGKFELTSKGVELLPYAQKMLVMADRFKERACETNSLSGMLRLGVSETIVHTWLSDFLQHVHHSFPNVDIELTVDVTANMRNELVSRSLDLAFLMGPISEFSIQNVDLCSFELAWVCSPEIELPEGVVPLQTILEKPVITYARNTRPFAEVQAVSKQEDIEVSRLFPSTSLAACKRMALDGLGIGMLPLALINEEVDQKRLRKISSTWEPSDLVFTASYPREPFNPLAEKMAALAADVAHDYCG